MAEDQAAGAAAAGLAGQRRSGHDAALQSLSEQPVQGRASNQNGEPAASQQPSWQQYNSVFTASKAGAAPAGHMALWYCMINLQQLAYSETAALVAQACKMWTRRR
jgi:hypothetical protein